MIGGDFKKRAALTSVALSLLFVVVYSSTNWLATTRDDVGTWYYSWEQIIPFVPLMIIPYMSIDLFFVAAPFLCRDRRELRTLAKRVSFAIVVAGICFLLFPLKLVVERPHLEGWLGAIYNPFVAMDAPHNLLPSLHIALRALLIPVYHARTRGWLRASVHVWFFLIGVSTLLTHQHHVIDVAGGFVLALLTIHLFPAGSRAPRARNVRVAVRYGVASAVLLGAGVGLASSGWGLPAALASALLFWPSLSLAVVSAGYFGIGGGIFRKKCGRLPLAARVLHAPTLIGHELSRRYYRRQSGAWSEVTPHIWIGSQLTASEARDARQGGVTAVIDLTAEFSEIDSLRGLEYKSLPVLDLTAPTQQQIDEAVHFLRQESACGVVYVHCKIGYSRSVAIVASYLIAEDPRLSVDEALARIRAVRPRVVVRPEVRAAIEAFSRRCRATTRGLRRTAV